jgi:membrane fusion protein, multidrug efflux system
MLKEDGKAGEVLLDERPRAEVRPAAPFKAEPVKAEHAPDVPPETSGAPRMSFLQRRPLATRAGAILLAAMSGGGYLYYDYSSRFETTDDAFVAARQTGIAPQVGGYVTQVPVTDNQHVKAGDVIARIDERPYRIALEQAEAQAAAAQAGIKTADAQIAVQQAQIEAASAQLEQAKAALTFARQQAERYETLARSGSGSIQIAQQSSSQLSQQQAVVNSAGAALIAAQKQAGMLQAQRASAEATLKQAIAQRDMAQLNLSYTAVTAAEPGHVVNLTAAPGQLAQPGGNLAMFVPDGVWVTANFKETQLNRMRPGAAVTLTADAYPGRQIIGHVASVQPGSGTAFSLLPAQNATGNYVKIVQRVPVKIVIDNAPADVAFGPGMSVVPAVRTDAEPSLYERLTSLF